MFRVLAILVGIALLIFWIAMLIDVLRSEFRGDNKIIWALVVIFLGVFGAALYYFIGRNQKVY